MKIYTKTGDGGTTGLFNGERVRKDSLRVETYGTVDELNSILGIVVSVECPESLGIDIEKISRLLFTLGSDLATPLGSKQKFEVSRIAEQDVEFLEGLIDDYTKEMPPLKNFILPGGTLAAAHLHHSRTVCRRAERLAVNLSSTAEIGAVVVRFLNRLSDYLFVAARYANHLSGMPDRKWNA
jgi:cob(I)alamin adenosyltransferase